MKAYGLSETVGDQYAKAWVVDAFAKCGIKYKHSKLDRSGVYGEALPLVTSGRVRLLDNRRLVNQFALLERRTTSGGKDIIDHGKSGSDDVSNAVAMALVTKGRGGMKFTQADVDRVAMMGKQGSPFNPSPLRPRFGIPNREPYKYPRW